MATGSAHLEIIVTVDTPWTRRERALAELECEVGHILSRLHHPALANLRGAYIASREAAKGLMGYEHPANCQHCKEIEAARDAARAEMLPKVLPDLKEDSP